MLDPPWIIKLLLISVPLRDIQEVFVGGIVPGDVKEIMDHLVLRAGND